MKIRNLRRDDLEKVFEIQEKLYSVEISEPMTVYESILNFYPPGCIGMEHEGFLQAYAFFHPWPKGKGKYPGSVLQKPPSGDIIWISDLGVTPGKQEKGIGSFMARWIIAFSREKKYSSIELFSMSKSREFWKKIGFKEGKRTEFKGTYLYYMTFSLE
jgi:GNAT superfamily N-acetyltransferase